MMRKPITMIVTIAACALAAYAFWNIETTSFEEEEEHHHHNIEEEVVAISEEQLQKHGIDIQRASPGRLHKVVKAPAKITIGSDQVAHIYPKVAGTALKANKNLGESVEADEILATLGSREMAEAKAEYLAAFNRDRLTEGTFQREKTLHEKKISATQEFHRAENAREESLIELELARQKLHALGLSEQEIEDLPQSDVKNLRVYDMRSPISGKVIARHVTPGELVNLDHEAYVVANLNKLWVEISIFPHDRQHIKEGQSVTISTHDGQTTKAHVIYLSPIINEDTRTSTAIAEIDNRSGKWFCGTYANAELVTDVINVPLMVAKEAIQNVDGTDVVFVALDEGFSPRPITTGRSDDHYYEITAGLSPGEAYASKNTFLLKAELKKDEAEHMD